MLAGSLSLLPLLLNFAAGLGAQKCTYGPSYWCKSLHESSECGATRFCSSRIWPSMELARDDDDVCKICLDMVAQARQVMESSQMQEQLKEVFEGSCELIPVKIISNECKTLADEFVVELVETLASEMNPQQVCAVAGLCNSERVDKLLKAFKSKKAVITNDKPCKTCRNTVDAAFRELARIDPEKFKMNLLDGCGIFSSYSSACRRTVLTNYRDIHSFLVERTKTALNTCDSIGICTETPIVIGNVQAGQPNDDVPCEFCEKVIQHWIDILTSSTTKEEFLTILQGFCKELPGERQTRCLHIIDEYFSLWYDFLTQEMNPKLVCTVIGICRGEGNILDIDERTSIFTMLGPEVTDETEIPLTEIFPAQYIGQENGFPPPGLHPEIQVDEAEKEPLVTIGFQDLIGGYFSPSFLSKPPQKSCNLCKSILPPVIEALNGNLTAENIEKELDAVCNKLPDEEDCEMFLDFHGPVVGICLSEGFGSSECCSALSPCPPEETSENKCALCEYAVTVLEGMITNKDNEEEIKKDIDKLCHLLPESLVSECDQFVSAYADQLIHMLINDMTPDQICTKLGLCSAMAGLTGIPQYTKCDTCEYVIYRVNSALGRREEDIIGRRQAKNALSAVCESAPWSFKIACGTFVSGASESLIDYFTQARTSLDYCSAFDYCPNEADFSVSVDDSEEEEDDDDDDSREYCELCEKVIKKIDELVTDKKNVQEVKEVLGRVCYFMSGSVKDQCLLMIDHYADEIVNFFTHDFDPAKVCKMIHICAGTGEGINGIADVNDVAPATHQSAGPCVLCELVVKELERELLNNRSTEAIERALQFVCAQLPDSIARSCENFVDEYGDEIIDIVSKFGPQALCSSLQLCDVPYDSTAKLYSAAAVGGNRCNWGPSYWCKSEVHAQNCGTAEYCRKYVWKDE